MAERVDRPVGTLRAPEDASSRPTDATAPPTTWFSRQARGTVPLNVLANFWRQLSLLIEVGVSLLRALYQIEKRTSHRQLRRTIGHVAAAIEAGSSFSEALEQHPRIFTQLTMRLIQVAERGGVLEDSLRLVADEIDRHIEIRNKVKRALAYPTMIAIIGIFVVLFVLVFVMPQFAGLFRAQGLPMPLVTRLVVGAADFFTRYWWLCGLGGLGLWWLFVVCIRSARGGLWWDRLILRLPLISELLIKAGVLRFAQTMGTLLRGGIPILVALKLVQEHAENRVLAQELEHICAAVEQGSRLEEPLRRSVVFPPLAVDIIAVGEEAGKLDTVLFRLAEAYKEEVDSSATVFSSIIEPILLLLMGILVALIVWAVYLPYFSLPAMM